MTDIPTITQEEAVEVREKVARAIDPAWWDWADRFFDASIPRDVEHREFQLTRADRAIIAALSPNMDHAVGGVPLQQRVAPWMQECFGPEISADRVERGDRFLEEALELLQSGGYDPTRVPALVSYVWGRPVGEPYQEVGGVMVTLAAYCLAFDLDMHEAGEIELARILHPEIVEKIRRKQATKAAAMGNSSPLPIATPPVNQDAVREALQRQTTVVERLCSAIERAEQDIGGESIKAVLADIGPANDHATAVLKGLTPPLDNTGLDAATVDLKHVATLLLWQYRTDATALPYATEMWKALDAALASGDRS